MAAGNPLQSGNATVKRAEQRLDAIRVELARRLRVKLESEGISYHKLAERVGVQKDCIFRILNPTNQRYAQAGIYPMARIIEWLGLTWGDIEAAQERRPVVLADVSQGIMELEDLPIEARDLLRRLTETAYHALHHQARYKCDPPHRGDDGDG